MAPLRLREQPTRPLQRVRWQALMAPQAAVLLCRCACVTDRLTHTHTHTHTHARTRAHARAHYADVLSSIAALVLLCALAEFTKIAQATSIGFAIMGFIGFFVKLIFIPINNIVSVVPLSTRALRPPRVPAPQRKKIAGCASLLPLPRHSLTLSSPNSPHVLCLRSQIVGMS